MTSRTVRTKVADRVPVGCETPGFFDDPAYGLGVMTDTQSPRQVQTISPY